MFDFYLTVLIVLRYSRRSATRKYQKSSFSNSFRMSLQNICSKITTHFVIKNKHPSDGCEEIRTFCYIGHRILLNVPVLRHFMRYFKRKTSTAKLWLQNIIPTSNVTIKLEFIDTRIKLILIPKPTKILDENKGWFNTNIYVLHFAKFFFSDVDEISRCLKSVIIVDKLI